MDKTYCLNAEEIKLLKFFNSKKKIYSIFYYYWINSSNPDENHTFIDVIEFVFNDNSSLFFKLNEDDSGISITQKFEFEKYKISLMTEFIQQIRLKKSEATGLDIWKSALKTEFKIITALRKQDFFCNTHFYIYFNSKKIEIKFHPIEGIVVNEYHEILK